ncbi:MAG TPA: GIY-YIG nuclease family protein [Stellaceae bacterium]|nr:GIY-YIG nuclease family protein [Stellaceae bacterium]
MAAKSFTLKFDGYWLGAAVGGLPVKSGIYGVYASTFNDSANTVTLNRLIYIGESENVQSRVKGHEKWPDWRKQLKSGEALSFNCALISGSDDRQRAEAAEIFKHKPVCNSDYTNNFPFDRTTISNEGNAALFVSPFTVERTEDPASKRHSLYVWR